MFSFIRRLLGREKTPPAPETLTAAKVFTTAVPTVNYVSRSEIERLLQQELERRDRMICITGSSKSGKTVAVKTRLPSASVVPGQVGLGREEVWRTLCAANRISLRAKDRLRGNIEGNAGVFKGGFERDTQQELDLDPRTAFLDFCRREQHIVFDDFHYFDSDTQRELLQGLRQLLHDRVAIVITLTHYGEDYPTLAEPDVMARIRFIKIPPWTKEDLSQILSKGFDALRMQVSKNDVGKIVDRSFGNPLVVQELGAFVCAANNVRDSRHELKAIKIGDADSFVRRAVREGALAGDKPTFMSLIIGRTPPRQRTEYETKEGQVGDVYFLVFSALRAFNLSAPIPYEALVKWIRDNVIKKQPPQGGQITTALDGLKKTSLELVKSAQDQGRSREMPVEWRSDIRTAFINDPFLRLYIKWADWYSEYQDRLGQMKNAGGQ